MPNMMPIMDNNQPPNMMPYQMPMMPPNPYYQQPNPYQMPYHRQGAFGPHTSAKPEYDANG